MTDSTTLQTAGHGSAPGGAGTLGGHPVARIGYGVMQLVGGASGSRDERIAAGDLLRSAVEQGVNHLDTAAFYGDAACNLLIRDVLAPYASDLVIVTKLGARHVPETGHLTAAQRPEDLRAGVEANLATLGVERLTVVNLRRVDGGSGLRAEADQRVDLDDQLAELIALRDAGKLENIGLSNVDADQLRASLPVGIACVQNAYSVLDRSNEYVLEVCRENGIAWVPFFPLGSAFPQFPSVAAHPEVIAVAREAGVTPAQVGLAWLLAHDDKTLLIPGTADARHLSENLAAGGVQLDAEALGRLDRIAG